MAKILWDQTGSHGYETGVDHGVLYPQSNNGVPWNGLTSVDEKRSAGSATPYYIDGTKYYDEVAPADYAGVLKAITYPDEFLVFDGVSELDAGFSLEAQVPQTFGLSYRTKIGDDISAETGYKIHLLYNLTAVPTDKSYGTITDSSTLSTFSWDITGVPEQVPGYRSTAHAIIDSTKTEPRLMAELEAILYGHDEFAPRLPSLAEITYKIANWGLVVIIDNGDGTWTAKGYRDHIALTNPTTFEIRGVLGRYIDEDTYEIRSTRHSPNNYIIDGPSQIDIVYNEDGSWTVSTDDPSLITFPSEGEYLISDVYGYFIDSNEYSISTTYSTDPP